MSESDLANLEANYTDTVKRHVANPTEKSLQSLAQKQVAIDDLRSDLDLSLRWYTKDELNAFCEDEPLLEHPREPLEIPQEDESVWVEKTKFIKARGRTTMTLDSVIEALQSLRKKLGGDVPVWHIESGGIEGTTCAEEWEGDVVIG